MTGRIPQGRDGRCGDALHDVSGLLNWTRALAALLVCIGHARGLFLVSWSSVQQKDPILAAFFAASSAGHEAVMVFFVLSGYLITATSARRIRLNSWRPSTYFLDRVVRLAVVLWPALLLTLILDGIGQVAFGSSIVYDGGGGFGGILPRPIEWSSSLNQLPANMGFLQTIAAPPLGSNGALWSVANEFWYYTLFGLALTAWTLRSRWRAALVPIFGCFFVAVVMTTSMLTYMGPWLAGAAVALLPRLKWLQDSAAVYRALLVFVSVLFISVAFAPLAPGLARDTATACAFSLLLAVACHRPSTKPMRRLSELKPRVSAAHKMASWSFSEFDGLIWPRGDGPSWPHLAGDVSGC